MSLTSLVDVIFLLLLFFMLTSTFSKFSEVTLSTASAGGQTDGTPPLFAQLYEDRLTINGETRSLDALDLTPLDGQGLILTIKDGVTAQRLTDALVAFRQYPDLTVSVLGASG